MNKSVVTEYTSDDFEFTLKRDSDDYFDLEINIAHVSKNELKDLYKFIGEVLVEVGYVGIAQPIMSVDVAVPAPAVKAPTPNQFAPEVY